MKTIFYVVGIAYFVYASVMQTVSINEAVDANKYQLEVDDRGYFKIYTVPDRGRKVLYDTYLPSQVVSKDSTQITVRKGSITEHFRI